MASVDSACAAQSEWPMKVKSAIAATVEFAASRPEQAQILSAGALAIDPLLAAEIFGSHDRLARALGGVRTDAPAEAQPPEGTEQFLVAASSPGTPPRASPRLCARPRANWSS